MSQRSSRKASRRRSAAGALHQRAVLRQFLAGELISVANLVGAPLVDRAGRRVGRVNDIVVRWEAGIDVSVRAFFRRLLHRRRHCPVPRRAIAWADVQHFSGSRHDDAFARGPADGAGVVGSSLQARAPRSSLRRLRAAEVASLLQELGRDQGAQAVSLVNPETAAEALRSLNDAQRVALLAQLNNADRERLESLMAGSQ